MTRFEYGRLRINYSADSMVEWLPDGTEERPLGMYMIRLNELGAQGWELVSHSTSDGAEWWHLMREKKGDT